jgi:hypothetical protein
MPSSSIQHSVQTTNLADILERVLDKGIVVAGDITISLVQVELLSIKVRLLVASVDKAMEMGINWWETDPFLSSRANQLEEENRTLRERLERLEQRLGLPAPLNTPDAPRAIEQIPSEGRP